MKCEKCRLVEMVVEKVENNLITHKCRNCGNEYIEEIKEKNKDE